MDVYSEMATVIKYNYFAYPTRLIYQLSEAQALMLKVVRSPNTMELLLLLYY